MENSPSSLLLCKENVASLGEIDEELDEFASIVEKSDDDEYVQMLLDREVANGGFEMPGSFQSCGGDWIGGARLDGIHYILRKRELLGFKFHTAYLSVTYLDRFLSRRSFDADKSWAIRLLSIACLSLAAKMEECSVPVLSDFCVEDYNFESNVIQRMELLVLNTLEWKMGSISPFSFTHFFLKKLRENLPQPRNLLSRVTEVILGATRDLKIMCHRPSVISAAATLVVLDQGLTRNAVELKIGPLASNLALGIEELISCYYHLQQMNSGIKSPELSPLQLQIRTEASSTSTSGARVASSKRKRLDFNQIDENKPEKKPKH